MIWGIGIAACAFVLLLILSTEGLLRLAFALLPTNGVYRWLLLAAAVGVVVWWGLAAHWPAWRVTVPCPIGAHDAAAGWKTEAGIGRPHAPGCCTQPPLITVRAVPPAACRPAARPRPRQTPSGRTS